MADNEENNGIGVVLRSAKAQGLVMSRVPKRIRDNFIKLAEDEFAGDYGMCLSFLWNNYELWLTFMQSWDIKLNYIINLISDSNEKKPESKKIKLLNGRIVEKEVK